MVPHIGMYPVNVTNALRQSMLLVVVGTTKRSYAEPVAKGATTVSITSVADNTIRNAAMMI